MNSAYQTVSKNSITERQRNIRNTGIPFVCMYWYRTVYGQDALTVDNFRRGTPRLYNEENRICIGYFTINAVFLPRIRKFSHFYPMNRHFTKDRFSSYGKMALILQRVYGNYLSFIPDKGTIRTKQERDKQTYERDIHITMCLIKQ